MSEGTAGRRAELVMGLDGGATHTRYLLADSAGEALASSQGGPSLLGAGEDPEVADRIAREVRSLVAASGRALPVDVLCAGLAGAAGRPESKAFLETRLAEARIAQRIRIVADSEVAFLDAFGEEDGILIIAGTGSVAVGRRASGGSELDGELRRIGGWGRLLGDEGSGYMIGLQGVRVAIRGAEARGPETSLSEKIFRVLEKKSPRGVFEWSKTASKAAVAALAPLVVEEAAGQDPQASAIVTRAVDGLVRHAEALRLALPKGGPLTVALVGGLIEPGGILHERVAGALEKTGFETLGRRVEPARGAVQLALDA